MMGRLPIQGIPEPAIQLLDTPRASPPGSDPPILGLSIHAENILVFSIDPFTGSQAVRRFGRL